MTNHRSGQSTDRPSYSWYGSIVQLLAHAMTAPTMCAVITDEQMFALTELITGGEGEISVDAIS